MNKHVYFYTYESAVDTSLAESENHLHNDFEIYYLTHGECWYLIDKHSYKISAGDLILIPPNVIHGTRYVTPTHSRKLVNCGEWYIPESARNLFFDLPCFTGTATVQKQIERLLSVIEKESLNPDEFSKDIIRSRVAQLLLLVARESKTTEQKLIESPMVGKAVEYIASHYGDPVSLSEVAAACYVSKEHLSRTFKQETGMGFSKYLTLYRLRKANSLLRDHPELRIIDVAQRCGFSESNYFSKTYKKMFGISPMSKKKENDNV